MKNSLLSPLLLCGSVPLAEPPGEAGVRHSFSGFSRPLDDSLEALRRGEKEWHLSIAPSWGNGQALAHRRWELVP